MPAQGLGQIIPRVVARLLFLGVALVAVFFGIRSLVLFRRWRHKSDLASALFWFMLPVGAVARHPVVWATTVALLGYKVYLESREPKP